MTSFSKGKAWVVTVDMGYGHQRAALPLCSLAYQAEIITANNYPGMPESDKRIWKQGLESYYFVSRLSDKGLVGKWLFGIYNKAQQIKEFYPRRPLSAPTPQLKITYQRIANGWGRHLIEKLSSNPLPFVTTFFTTAFMAEYWKYPGPILLVVTDSDISRAWAPLNPKTSPIIYCASSRRAGQRLSEYGVLPERIVYTGFPLPLECVAPASKNLERRLSRLDPEEVFAKRYKGLISQYLKNVIGKSCEPITISFAVGGAGAHAGIGAKLVVNLAGLIRAQKIALNLVAGISFQAAQKFQNAAKSAGLESFLNGALRILYWEDKQKYLADFNEIINATDILWTKPSELSFYGALGIPIVIAPAIGSHEEKNRQWLIETGAGIDQSDPRWANEWLEDLLAEGHFARMAFQGFVEMDRNGSFAIAKLVTKLSQ